MEKGERYYAKERFRVVKTVMEAFPLKIGTSSVHYTEIGVKKKGKLYDIGGAYTPFWNFQESSTDALILLADQQIENLVGVGILSPNQ